MSTFEIPTDWVDQQLVDRMGITLTEVGRDRVVGTMPVDGNRQPFGLLHGGASCVLVETLGSYAAAIYALPLGKTSAGLELNATHVRSAVSGIVTGVAVPVHLGGSIATHAVTITDDQGRTICSARITCVLRDRGGLLARATGAQGPT
jgi:1,4-dihydroxy-2-naphthoyl-CoA hydrolase